MAIRLNEHEQEMLAGAHGPARRYGMEQIVKVGDFFDAADCENAQLPVCIAETVEVTVDGVRSGAHSLEIVGYTPTASEAEAAPCYRGSAQFPIPGGDLRKALGRISLSYQADEPGCERSE